MVIGMIHVGGVTRLTRSGLSMTDWNPIGGLPPISKQEWEIEFDRYKQFPEWSQRKDMTVDEFKFIYFWEYSHRMLGRVTGVVFALPWVYFSVRGKIPAGYQKKMLGLFAMGGTQGLVGWWMVKSGLGDDRREDRREIRVQPIRLASHLTMALVTYGALLWTGLDIFSLPHSQTLKEQATKLSKDALQRAARLRSGAFGLVGLTTITVVSGALVAGNDAGRAFNSWPKMGDDWVPPDLYDLVPWERNLTENTATVQFNHRILGATTAVSALGLAAFGLAPARAIFLTPQARKGLYVTALAATGQFTLGVATLLHYVPLTLAAAHQLGSVVVFSGAIYTAHAMRYARPNLTRSARAAKILKA
jgi:cytochrome c oxidase assembly protein subunit 15